MIPGESPAVLWNRIMITLLP